MHADGWFLGTCFLITRVIGKFKSVYFSKLLGAAGINLGPGCQIFGGRNIRFGKDISVHGNLWLEAVNEYAGKEYSPLIILGDRVKMSDRVHITAINEINIGNDVLIGSNVYLSDHNHGAYNGVDCVQSSPDEAPAERILYSTGAVIIENNVWIGDNVNVVGPLKIGYGSIVAANSVVRKDVPPCTIVAGSPARIIKIFNKLTQRWEKF